MNDLLRQYQAERDNYELRLNPAVPGSKSAQHYAGMVQTLDTRIKSMASHEYPTRTTDMTDYSSQNRSLAQFTGSEADLWRAIDRVAVLIDKKMSTHKI